MANVNPYADSNGKPTAGKYKQYFSFERALELKRRKGLPPERVAELENAENNLANKMNS